jgi:Tol biopolymer transport system component/tRNA A-37 threonylcarbamoyl transferase component Bud32
MLGASLRHYRLDAKIGEGGMGVVYKAWDTHLQRPVAVKVLAAKAVADPERKRRFVQEAQAASALNHPNIVTIYDVDCVDGVDFMAMEYIEGETLERCIGSRGMRLSLAIKYALQIADALTRAHGAGIIHRDLKPGNIMLDRHEQVKVLDFGLAKLVEKGAPAEETTLTLKAATEEGTIVGTVAYMSPEQAEGKLVDARSDIFSFGTVLYEMITGSRPFHGETRMSTLSAILTKEPDPVASKAAGMPHELERIVSRCLRKDPKRRFQQMAEVKLALEDLKEELESGSAVTVAASAKPKRRVIVPVAAVLALLFAVVGFVWWRGRSAAPPARPTLTRITFDSGWTTDPALSSDGKLLTYASDRSGGNNLDIWVQHLGGGDPVRLTNWNSDEMQPDFSPDGSRIVFQSNRQGGGIYVVPVLGGEPALVAPKGVRPRFSPDGNWIAYTVATEGARLSNMPHHAFAVPANGGAAKQVAADLASASYPVWSADSKSLLVAGNKGTSSTFDWWIVPLEGGPSRNTEMFAGFRQKQIQMPLTNPEAWTRDGWILFSGGTGDSSNLYRVRLARNGKIKEDPEKITFGTGMEMKCALSSSGQLAFANQIFTSHLWILPGNTNRGAGFGEMQLLTTDETVDTWPRITLDGKNLTYFAESVGTRKLMFRNLESGTQKQLAPKWFFPGVAYGAPLVARGTRAILSAGPQAGSFAGLGVYMLELNRGAPVLVREKARMLCASADGKYLLAGSENSIAINIETGKDFPFASFGGHLLSPQFSPDGRWVVLHHANSETTRQIFVLPFHEGRSTERSEWIAITDGKQLDREPQWSPDGNMLYFLADRDGARGIYAQRLDQTKHPVGVPFEVKMFRTARRSMMHFANSGDSWPAVAVDKMVFPLGEMRGNIWMSRLP